jgi:hypothetical protein
VNDPGDLLTPKQQHEFSFEDVVVAQEGDDDIVTQCNEPFVLSKQ